MNKLGWLKLCVICMISQVYADDWPTRQPTFPTTYPCQWFQAPDQAVDFVRCMKGPRYRLGGIYDCHTLSIPQCLSRVRAAEMVEELNGWMEWRCREVAWWCEADDHDKDGDIDLADFALFQQIDWERFRK